MNRLGPGLLLLPLVTFGAAALWWGPSHGASPELVEDGPALRPAWLASAPYRGRSVELRLAPLWASPVQRGFEAEALRERRALSSGELWRLELRLSGESASVGDPALDPRGWRVVDDEGVALTPLEAPDSAHPVDRLLAARPLRPGAGESVFFWGREPGPGARLEGFGGSRDGSPSSVDLVRGEVDGAEFPRYLARVPAPGADAATSSTP